MRDLTAGSLTRVSVSSKGAQADGDSFDSAASDDGGSVSFESTATNLVTMATGGYNAFLRRL